MKTFIQNNKRKLLLILAAVLIVCTFSGFMLTASAFTLATGWTVTYRDGEATSWETTDDMATVTDFAVKGSVADYGLAINGQVYGNANIASTLTANRLKVATLGESSESGGYYYNTYLYYKLESDTYFTRAECHASTTESSKKVTAFAVTLTEPGTYTICAVSCDYYVDADDTEETYARSAFLTVIVDPSYTLPENPTKTGYTFSGWYTDQNCTTKFEGDTITSDLVLYAGWTANSYTVIFNGNGATNGTMANQQFTYNTKQALRSNAFARTGYNFEGWALSDTATVQKYTNEQEVQNLASEDGATITLFAVWSPSSFTITFNANGGVGTMPSQVIEYDAATPLNACTFTREGYIFKGWATSIGGVVVYKDMDSVKNLSTDPNNPVQLYAVWEIIQCNVTFIVDGKVYAVVTVDYGTPTEEVIADVVDANLYNVEEQSLPLE